ncbi:GNAT family N-acetyltransferase [Leptolyngbya sp. FACHB-17]|uniref:GNAT family N-acetyltransferase n=1 Tax=Leptolyngbya sp. FACHB-17 TaxID=2692803 RepID=UPI0018EFF143
MSRHLATVLVIDMLTLERLNSITALPYQAFTFPTFRSHLQCLGTSCIAIGAVKDGCPVGLILAELSADLKRAEVRSIFVTQSARNQGIGTALLGALEQSLADQGCAEVQLVYMTGKPSASILERLLEKYCWTVPQTRMLVGRSTIDRMAQAPWMAQSHLPATFTIFPWDQLTHEERSYLQHQQITADWIPSDLAPLEQEPIESLNSLGVRYQGTIVGWVITHRLNLDTIRYTCSFIRADFQRRGRIIPLYVEAIRRQAQAGIRNGIWTVPLRHTAMFNFVQNRMAPYMTSIALTKGAKKSLSSEQSG